MEKLVLTLGCAALAAATSAGAPAHPLRGPAMKDIRLSEGFEGVE